MGCSPAKELNLKRSILKIQSTDNLARKFMSTAVFEGQNNTERCLKIIIKETNVEDWEVYNEIVKAFASENSDMCIEIYEFYTMLEILLGNFENRVHAVCIPEFDLIKGFEALIIYLNINSNTKFNLKTNKFFPILELHSTKNACINLIVQSWNNLANFIIDDRIRLCFERNSNKIKSAMCVNLQEKNKKLGKIFKATNKYVLLALSTLARMREIKSKMNNFMDSFKTNNKKLLKVSKLLKELDGLDIHIVVHNLESYWNN